MTTNYQYHTSETTQEVLLGERAFTDYEDSIKVKIARHALASEHWRKQIKWFEEREKGTEAADVETARASRIETQALLDKAETAIEALTTLHNQVKVWKKLDSRVLGHILRSPAICLGVGEKRFTEDWALFEVDQAKLGEGFRGNVMNLGAF